MEMDEKASASGDISASSGKRKKENEISDVATEEKPLRVLLGSSSKWRKMVVGQSIPDTRLFRLLDRTISPDIDEKAIRNPIPHKLVLEIARAKAKRVLEILKEEEGKIQDENMIPDIVICSDQVIAFQGTIREKPNDAEQAKEFLRSYGQTGMPAVCTNGVVVTRLSTGETFEGVQTALIYFTEIPDDVIDALIAKGDVFHCAGGFVVEDELLKPYTKLIEGEYESIMGMPVSLTKTLIWRASGYQ